MKVAQGCCVYCAFRFEPDPRAIRVVRGIRRVTQKTCGRAECGRARGRRKLRRWRELHPDHAAKYAPKVRAWAKAYPDYWRRRRKRCPEYARRDDMRRARAARAARRSANETGIALVAVEKLSVIAALREAGCSANETGIARRVSALEDYALSTSRHRVPPTVTGMDRRPTLGDNASHER